MTFATWRLTRLCNSIYRRVRLDFLRISILTGNTGEVWKHDEFVLGFLCTRVGVALSERRTLTNLQRDEIMLNVLMRLTGRRPTVAQQPAPASHELDHGLQFQDGVALARRLGSERRSKEGLWGPAIHGCHCLRLSANDR